MRKRYISCLAFAAFATVAAVQPFSALNAQASEDTASATLRFERPQAEGRLKQLMTQNGLKPYRVFMSLDGQYGRHTVPAANASVEVIDQARATTAAMEDRYGKSLTKRQELVDSGKLPDQAREKIEAASSKRAQRSAALQRGKPIIYGLWVVGKPEALDAIGKVPGVTVTQAIDVAGTKRLVDPEPVAN